MSSPHVFPHWEIQLYTTLQLHDYKYQIGWHSLSVFLRSCFTSNTR